jgi:pimeloyl-ACP methyl ester carboxylesterase
VFGEIRNFRVFLPPGYYDNPGKKYPVIYYYHGWSQRYFGSGPDSYSSIEKGDDNNGDNIANFVADHEVIVVKPDGYNRSPGEEYYLRPYNVLPVETFRQFPVYFPELVSYIDASYRTLADRNHRAISGLSMGGFMSFWIGGKYPQLISAIGNFCGSPEFIAGPKDFPVEYRHIDMYKNYAGINVRLNFGNEDFIRYYHRDMNKIWTQVMDNYEFKIYKAAHSTCGLREMFEFIMKTFENPPVKPAKWDHIDVYPEFSVWDYNVSSDRDVPGFTILENVDRRGFRCSVREHLPDGELLPFVKLCVTTPPIYEKNTMYTINDIDVRNLQTVSYTLKSDNNGILKINLSGSSHELGINKTGDKANICMASFTYEKEPFATGKEDVTLKISLLNKGIAKGEGIKASLSATRKSAQVLNGAADLGDISINEIVASKSPLTFRITADSIEIEKFRLKISDKSNNEWTEYFEIPIINREIPEIKEFEIADGRKVTVAKEGINSETIVLGSGNGDGLANPGESIVILVKDSGKLWRANVIANGKYINPNGINIRESDNWGSYDYVGGSSKYSIPVISSDCPENQMIGFIVEYWLPDNPNHIIKQGRINLKVSGRDQTPPVMQWVRITGDNVIQAKIYDGAAVRNVSAKLILKDNTDKFFEVELVNDGTNGDRAKDDNVFSYQVPESKFGFYKIEISAADLSGNMMKKASPEIFVLH